MNRKQVLKLRKDLEAVAQLDGYSVSVGSARFGDGHVTFRVTVAEVNADGSVCSPEAEAFIKLAPVYGLSAEDLGKTIVHPPWGGRKYTITGLAPRSTKYPVLAKREDGKTYKLPAAAVRQALTREAA